MRHLLLSTLLLLALASCSPSQNSDSHILGHWEAMCEMVRAGAKPLGVSYPMPAEDMDRFVEHAAEIAQSYGVKWHREKEWVDSDLFPGSTVEGMEVLLAYQGLTLDDYQQLKEDRSALEESGRYTGKARETLARRLGRLLGYSPQGINTLLADNTPYRALTHFDISATSVFLYYEDLAGARKFYEETLGLEVIEEFEYAVYLQIAESAYLGLVDANVGMHGPEESKSVAVAFLTNELAGWWEYLTEAGVPIKYTYKPRDGGPHDGFVAIDPEGYLLEFEAFKQHPENERFVPQLRQNPSRYTQHESSKVPEGLGFHSTITWLYYEDLLQAQNFYDEVLGFTMVADQGWTKIYQASPTGFVGLVDARRGMNDFAETKAVNMAFHVDHWDDWLAYYEEQVPFPMHEVGVEETDRYQTFYGYDPGKYVMEFLRFKPQN